MINKNYVFKIVIAILLVIALTVSVISCKEAPAIVEEQQEEEQETVPSETTETTPEETKEETPPVVEETPEEIEWEGVKITPIEGLRFDKGTFYAEAGNPYNLEEGEKAGVFVKDAVEINGIMESSIGLRPEVIEVMQKEIMEKEKRFVYPFIIDLEQAKVDLGQDQVIKIREVESHEAEQTPEENRIFNTKDTFLAVSNVPKGTIIYAPSSTLMTYGEDVLNMYGGSAWFSFDITPNLFKEEIINNNKVDYSDVTIIFSRKGIESISQEIEKEFTEWRKKAESDLFAKPPETETKMGTPLVKVIDKVNLKEEVLEKDPEEEDVWHVVGLREADHQVEIYFDIRKQEILKFGKTGLRNLLEIGGMKAFILPAYD